MNYRRVALYLVVLTLVSAMVRCDWSQSQQPSTILIAIEGLDFLSVQCGSDRVEVTLDKGFSTLCEETIRFTHAFTPSVMSQAAMASLLTGHYPMNHGALANGSQHLRFDIKTVAEVAASHGVRTSFLSGGAPIFRKSGLHQGFYMFEDQLDLSLAKPFVPAREIFGKLMDWINSDPSPYFSVSYLADLQFPERATYTEEGLSRQVNELGQLEELDEALGRFFNKLKEKKLWHRSHIIVVGLNSMKKSRRLLEVRAINLFSENTQVALFIKPAGKERDLDMQWNVDRNVTLADVGATLMDVYGDSRTPVEPFPIYSLRPILAGQEATWPVDRLIPIESGWPQWRGVGSPRMSFRSEHFLILFDQDIKAYHSLIDRQEQSPISPDDSLWGEFIQPQLDKIEQEAFVKWNAIPTSLALKLKKTREMLNPSKSLEEYRSELLYLSKVRSWDGQVWGWLAEIAIEMKDWSFLERIGIKQTRPLWIYVAQSNFNKPTANNWMKNFCEKLFVFPDDRTLDPNKCEDLVFSKLILWWRSMERSDEIDAQENFLRQYVFAKTDDMVARKNFQNGLVWDVNVDDPGEPSLSDLFLQLPGKRKTKMAKIVEARLNHLK